MHGNFRTILSSRNYFFVFRSSGWLVVLYITIAMYLDTIQANFGEIAEALVCSMLNSGEISFGA